MNHDIFAQLAATVVIISLIVGVILMGANLYGRYLRISRGKGALLLLAAVLAAIGFGFWHAHELEHSPPPLHFGDDDFDKAFSVGLAALLPLAGVPFLAKFYLTWIAGAVTEAEKAPGMEGVRAWLRGGNLFCAVLVSLCLWLGFGYSFWMPVALALMALMAFPILNMVMETTSPQPTAPAGDALSPDRERVLKMLDDGKITAQESAELLNALGQSARPCAPQSVPVPHRRLVWVGAAVLLVGFFLPWFVIRQGNFQEALKAIVNQMAAAPGMPGMPTPNLGRMLPPAMTISVVGGDIAHGLGWWVLALGIVAAVAPFVAANVDSQTCQRISLVALGAGAIILIYLLIQAIRYVNIGILLVLAGYVLEFIGVLKERRLDLP
jgi:hypothetical protein